MYTSQVVGNNFIELKENIMNELNSDTVLWVTLAALLFTALAFVGFSLKIFRAMEEKDEDEDEDTQEIVENKASN